MEHEAHLKKNPRGSSPQTDEGLTGAGQIRRRPTKKSHKDGATSIGSPAVPVSGHKESGKG